MQISKILEKAKIELEKAGVANVGLDSLILLCSALSFSKEQIVFNPTFEVDPKLEQQFFELVKRRCKREPISHLIGQREFFGRDFLVSKNVLDPRPDSENLIELVLEKIPQKTAKIDILEIGVGSGCLIISLVSEFKNAIGVGLDISELALEIAQKNAEKNQVENRLKFLKSDLFSALNLNQKFDLIISNPPYISSDEIENLQAEVRDFEPRLALDGGVDGLDFYRRIALEAKNFLKENGRIFLEIGFGQKEAVEKIFNKSDFSLNTVKCDLAGVERILEFS